MNTKQFAVIHIEKGSSNSSRLGAHIDRSFTPKNADPEKAELNEHHINNGQTLKQDVDQRLKEVGCKVRSNSVKSMNIVISGSHDRMKEIEKDPELFRNWVNDNKQFLERKYGKENMMRFSVHRDERTPHIHCVVTPITKDGRLSAKEIVGNKKDLQQLQEDYGQAMNHYGLNRGVKGSKATHDSIAEYYARINDPLETEISIPDIKRFKSVDENKKLIKTAILPLKFNLEKMAREIKAYKQHLAEINEYKEHLEREQEKIKTAEQVLKIEKQEFSNDKKTVLDTEFHRGVIIGREEAIRVMNRSLEKANEPYIMELKGNKFELKLKVVPPAPELKKEETIKKPEIIRDKDIKRKGPTL